MEGNARVAWFLFICLSSSSSSSLSAVSPPLEYNTTALAASLDGTIVAVDADSRLVLWSFHSGEPIYSSYCHASASFYLDCGDDWGLYVHGPRYEGGAKLATGAEEFLKQTPMMTAESGVVIGSKKCTVFLLDAKSGRLIHAFDSEQSTVLSQIYEEDKILRRKDIEDSMASIHADIQDIDRLCFVFRTDYLFRHVSPETKELWHLRFAEIKASFQGHKAVSVYRIRDHSITESNILSHIPANPHPNVITAIVRSTQAPLDLHMAGTELSARYNLSHVLGFGGAILAAFVIHWVSSLFKKSMLNRGCKDVKHSALVPRKKKSKKSGIAKVNAAVEPSRKAMSESMVANTIVGVQTPITEDFGQNTLPHLPTPGDCDDTDGHRIGKLYATRKIIARGSNGTVVLEGTYDGRPVAVKRLVKSHHDDAMKEIQNLIASDSHPNIVHWYGVEYDRDFIYLSLERCTCSLEELISSDRELRKSNGHPTVHLLKLMRDITLGLAHLHDLRIIHRDLKPSNVLIVNDRSVLHAKLSDMGISKRLPSNVSSLTQNVTGCGSSGWQPPEQLLRDRQTRAADLFSLGCVFFYCITGGNHPFGSSLERDFNIMNNKKDLFVIEDIPEAHDLITSLLDPDPDSRLKAVDVSLHPLFWDADMRLSFLRDSSDRVESEKDSTCALLIALEATASIVLGGRWDAKMERAFINDLGHFRRYRFNSVRCLLRVIRNKFNHYGDLSTDIQGILGHVPEGFNEYFSSRFPNLLMEVYKVIRQYCGKEKMFCKYFERKGE